MHLKLDKIFKYNPHVLTFDAAENAFFSRELEHIIPELFEFTHARINARSIFPIDRSAGPAAETITFRQFTKTGLAKIISDYANDIPLVNVFGEEFTGNVRSIAIAAKWSIQEIRAAAMAGRPLDRQQAEAARETMLRLENAITFNGDAAHGLIGLFTDPNIPTVTVVDPGGGTEWVNKTAAQILTDMNDCANAIVENTGDIEVPNTMLLPTEQFNLIASTNAGLGTDTTILRFFLNNNPYISEVMNIRELDQAGTASADVMVAYDRNPSKLKMQVPLDIEQLAPQEVDLCVKVPYHMRVGGLTIHKPLSLNICEGI
jgi:hypothetical protein